MFGISQLGAATGSVSPGGDAEWNAYFGALRDHVNAKWSSAVDAYKTLKNVRETLGLPFIVQGTGEGSSTVGAWSSDLEQQAVNVHAMTVLITGALDDVVANKRRVAPSENGEGWAVERLPSDVLRLEVKAPGIPVLVNAQTGQPENVQGTVSAIWVLVAAGAVVTAGAIYLAVRAIDSLNSMMKEKTTQTIAKRNGELIARGKATPEQAAALTKAEGQAAADLAKARAEENNSGASPEKWSPLVKTIVWGGVAIMGLWIAAKLIPSRSGGLATNPIKRRKWTVTPVDPAGRTHTTRIYDSKEIAQSVVRDLKKTHPHGWSYVMKPLRSINPVEMNPLSLAGVDFLPNPSGAGWYLMHYERGYRAGVTDFKGPFASRSKATEHIPSAWERRYLIKKLSSQRALALAFETHERSANPMLSSGNWSSPTLPPRKYHLERVPLNQGYTKAGRYFGVGKPLYEYWSTDNDVHGFLRASSRAEAKQHLRDEQGGALFFNPLSLASINLV